MFVVELSYLFVLPARKKYKVPINGLCRGQMVVNVNATEWHTGFCPRSNMKAIHTTPHLTAANTPSRIQRPYWKTTPKMHPSFSHHLEFAAFITNCRHRVLFMPEPIPALYGELRYAGEDVMSMSCPIIPW